MIKMRSIRTKIITAFLIVICVTIVLIVSIIIINVSLENRYKQINQNIIYEQQLKDNIWFLVEDIYNALKSNDYIDYDKRLAEIRAEESILDVQFADPSVNEETKLDYRSVKNSLNAVIDLTESTRKSFESTGNISGISNIFTDASTKFDFVKQNTTDLLFAEVKNIANTTQDIQKIQNLLTPIALIILFLSSLGLTIFSILFARKITKPLISLSTIAKGIIDGNTDLSVAENLLKRKDEIGSLSISFDAMIKKLREKIIGLELSSKELSQANNELGDSKRAITNLLEDVENEKSKVEETVKIRTQELSDEKSRLLASINSLSSGYVLAGMDGTIILNNNAIRNILEVDKNPKAIADLSKYFDKFDLVNSCKECLISNKVINIKDIEYKNKFLRLFCGPVSNNGQVIGHVLLIEDMTEAKILERSKDEFFAVASHELRTPLTAIRGNTEMIMGIYADKVQDQDVREMISDIETASVRLIGIVNDFLEVSRLEQGNSVFEKTSFDVSELITKVTSSIKLLVAAQKINFKLLRPESLPNAFADKAKTEQVLFNLMGNAAKFTKEGTITISTALEGNFLKIRVSDTGSGISEKSTSLLFRKFQPAGEQALARDVSKSTGLGLYISKIITEKMGGTIGLEKSQVGIGSTFFFTLPIAP